jgi:osmotically-inducible protein OsmY
MKRKVGLVLASALIAAPMFLHASTRTETPKSLDERVRHELLMLPYYNVFDELSFQVKGDQVVLLGEVTTPTLRHDAERVVKAIPGVEAVKNNIEVLPLSRYDDSLRLAVLRAVYWQPGLDRYGLGTQPSIRIIVKNGNVTLSGVVNSEVDRNLAALRANGVPGVFSVTNNLRVATS